MWDSLLKGLEVFFLYANDIVPLHNPLTKVATKVGLLFDWFHRHHMEPITDDLSFRKQNMFFVEMESV